MSPWLLVETDNYLSLPPDLRKNYHQLIFRKRTRDVLSNPKADLLLTQLKVEEYILFGVGIERAIKSLALGLLARHKRVAVVRDACGWWSAGDGELALRQLAAKSVRLTGTAEVVAPPAPTKRPSPRARRLRYRCRTSKPAVARHGRTKTARH